MNKLRLKEFNEERVVYLYTPEGKGAPGEVVYVFNTKNASVSKRADDDETGMYGHNATRKLKEFVEKDHYFPLEPIQAWN